LEKSREEVSSMEYRTSMTPDDVKAATLRYFRTDWPYVGKYGARENTAWFRRNRWLGLVADHAAMVTAIPEAGRTTVTTYATRRDWQKTLEEWADETFGVGGWEE
jgi:hypothetical protein